MDEAYSGPERRNTAAGRRVLCPHGDEHHKVLFRVKHESRRTLLLNYLVSSAAIAVLILVYHVFQLMKKLEHSVPILMNEQNKTLEQIHLSVHQEGMILRETIAERHRQENEKAKKK